MSGWFAVWFLVAIVLAAFLIEPLFDWLDAIDDRRRDREEP